MTPFETHLTPVIALEHEELEVNNESVQVLSLQTDEDDAAVVAVAATVVVAQKQTPSVPVTQLVVTEYDEHELYGIQAVPVDVQAVYAENARHPAWVVMFVVESEHN